MPSFARLKRPAAFAVAGFLLLSLVLLAACTSPLGNAKTTQAPIKVSRGDITVTVTGSGNLALANEVKLNFGISGRVASITVKEGDRVRKGDVLAGLETDALELAVKQAEVALTQAELNVVQGRAAVQSADIGLEKAQDTYKWPDIEIARTEVDNAKAYAQYAIDTLQAATTPEERARWTGVVMQAQASLAAAEAKLDAMLTGAEPKQVELARIQVESANQTLLLARQSLELAAQSLEQAQKQLEKAALKAPFDGAVAEVPIKVGDMVAPTTMAVYLMDMSSMELKVQIDEIDISQVKPGQPASIELDALGAANRLAGEVAAVGLVPVQKAGVTEYDATININTANSTALKAGMSATADITTGEAADVLLVPERAITRDSQGRATVQLVTPNGTEERAVVTGLSDGLNTEIRQGLSEGDTVLERRAVKQPGIL